MGTSLIYCIDGEDSQRLRMSEFATHAAYIGSVVDRMQLGAPLSTRDTEAGVGDADLAAALPGKTGAAWAVLAIPRLSGEWAGVSPDSVMARTR